MPNNKPGSRLIKAAGAVAWRPGPDGRPEILLVHRKKYDDWSLPKGKVEPDEPLPVTAVREVLEEGGARLALGRRLISVRYNVGGRPKRVHYWAARVLSVDEHAVPNAEVDEVAWVPADRAVDKVSYTHDHGVLADFSARPAPTVPLILLRHSKALSKNGWNRRDAARPLDDSGRADARALTHLLACFAPRPRLISSTAVRCTDTLRPLSQLTGEQVRAEPSLYIHKDSPETSRAASRSDVTALVREVIAAGQPTIICAHRENLPVLREAALAALTGHGADDPGAGDETLPTSGFWVLNVAPLPPAPDQEPPAPDRSVRGAAPPLPSVPATAPPSMFRRWWRRILGTTAARDVPGGDAGVASGADDPLAEEAAGRGTGGEAHADGVSTGEANAAGAAPGDSFGPVGILVSADRYDLSEC